MILLGGHFRRLSVFFFDPTLALGTGSSSTAAAYGLAEERVTAALGVALADSPMGPVHWSARRVRSAESLLLQLLRAVGEAKEAAARTATVTRDERPETAPSAKVSRAADRPGKAAGRRL